MSTHITYFHSEIIKIICRYPLLIWSYGKELPYQGPVVQSFVSLTSSLRVILLTVLADSISNILIFFAEKM